MFMFGNSRQRSFVLHIFLFLNGKKDVAVFMAMGIGPLCPYIYIRRQGHQVFIYLVYTIIVIQHKTTPKKD
jgi:hypothetical protein